MAAILGQAEQAKIFFDVARDVAHHKRMGIEWVMEELEENRGSKMALLFARNELAPHGCLIVWKEERRWEYMLTV